MHTIQISREQIGGCYEVALDGKFVSATPSEKLAGETVLELLGKTGEVCLVGLVDNGPANRDKANRSAAQQQGRERAEAQRKVAAGRAEPEPWRP